MRNDTRRGSIKFHFPDTGADLPLRNEQVHSACRFDTPFNPRSRQSTRRVQRTSLKRAMFPLYKWESRAARIFVTGRDANREGCVKRRIGIAREWTETQGLKYSDSSQYLDNLNEYLNCYVIWQKLARFKDWRLCFPRCFYEVGENWRHLSSRKYTVNCHSVYEDIKKDIKKSFPWLIL